MTKKIDKKQFAKMIAKKGGYFEKDAEDIVDIIIEILGEIITNRWEFSVNNFAKLVYSKKKAHRNMGFEGKMVDIPEKETVRLQLSNALKKLLEK